MEGRGRKIIKNMNSEQLLLLVQDLKELERKIESRGLYPPNLKTDVVKEYYEAITSGSLPEHATYRVFEVLCEELFGEVPQIQVKERAVVPDYAIIENSYRVAIEVKSPFVRTRNTLRRNVLQPRSHSDQVRNYLSAGFDYVILTDAYKWYFYSRSTLLTEEITPFAFLSIEDLLQERRLSIVKTCRMLERSYPLRDLDKYFFRDLKGYVREFEELLGEFPSV